MLKFSNIFFICISIVLTSNVLATDLNYKHKQLNKELLKTWQVDNTALIEMQNISDLTINESKLFKVENAGVLIGYVYVGRIKSCRAGGCSIDQSQPLTGAYEYFDTFILFNKAKDIEKVKVYNYQATHGHEVCSRGWLKQYIGYNTEKPLEVGKSIDGISGATISVQALTDEINYISQLLKNS